MKYALIHRNSLLYDDNGKVTGVTDGCGGVAMICTEKPDTGVVLGVDNTSYPNGDEVRTGDPVKCSNCGYIFDELIKGDQIIQEIDQFLTSYQEIQ